MTLYGKHAHRDLRIAGDENCYRCAEGGHDGDKGANAGQDTLQIDHGNVLRKIIQAVERTRQGIDGSIPLLEKEGIVIDFDIPCLSQSPDNNVFVMLVEIVHASRL